jgi:uncharacterized protein YndB with AHSA1/START domain
MKEKIMTERSVTHATFTVERTYDAAPEKVFAAFANPAEKRRWFAEGEGWHADKFEMDFRPGGIETCIFRFGDGPTGRNDTVYQDIVENRRIIAAYTMTIGGNRISASLATIEFEPAGAGTRLKYTEQDAFLDGHDNAAQREEGCRGLLETLAAQLDRQIAA